MNNCSVFNSDSQPPHPVTTTMCLHQRLVTLASYNFMIADGRASLYWIFISLNRICFFPLYFSSADCVTGHVAEWIRKREITSLNPSADSLDLFSVSVLLCLSSGTDL